MSKKLNKKDMAHMSVQYEIITNGSKQDSRFTPVKIWIAHEGKNLNKSFFSKEQLEAMIPSVANIPVLGYIEVDDKNREDFKAHEERYIVTQDGVTTEYLGRAYGLMPETNNARFEKKTVNGVEREYLVADGLVWNKFDTAREILDRDEIKGQSMELLLESFDGYYDQKADQFVVTSAELEGLCMLGDSKMPAMVGGAIEKTQFTNIKYQLQSLMEDLQESEYAEKFTAKTEEDKEGGDVLDIKILEGLLPNYTYVSAEFTEELKGKLSTYETEEALKAVLETENDTQFALTVKAQMNLLQDAVGKSEMFTDSWGDEYSRYRFKDANLESGEVFCIDRQEYMDVGFTFTQSGDMFELNLDSRFSIAWQPVKLAEGETPQLTFSQDIKEVYEAGTAKIESAKETVTLDLNTKFEADLAIEKTKYDTDLAELEELRTYKIASQEGERTAYVNSIENLDEKEKEVLIGKITEYTMESLKDEVVKVIGLKSIKYTTITEKPIQDDFTPKTPSEGESKSFDHLMNK